MALSIRQAAPIEGVQWTRGAFRLFLRRPLPFTAMFVAFLVVALLATLLPVVGGVLMLMSLPLLSLGFMLGSRAARNDLPVHPRLFIEPLRGDRPRRNALLVRVGGVGAAVPRWRRRWRRWPCSWPASSCRKPMRPRR